MVFQGDIRHSANLLKKPPSVDAAHLPYRISPANWRIIRSEKTGSFVFDPKESGQRVLVNLGSGELRFSFPSCALPPLHFLLVEREICEFETEGEGSLLLLELVTLPAISDFSEGGDRLFLLPAAASSLVESLVGERGDVSAPVLVQALTALISPCLCREFEEDGLARFRSYISQHLDQPISTDDIASALGMSSSRLREMTQKIVEMTPEAYLREERVMLARELLSTTAISIETIAERTGYSDRFAFTRAFSAATGKSPHAYRESMTAQNDNTGPISK